jgi:CRISPR/Cas system-associated protein Cas5 (RAMP superfamily)
MKAHLTFTIILILWSCSISAQSRKFKKLQEQNERLETTIAKLEERIESEEKEKESLSQQLKRISPIEVDEVIPVENSSLLIGEAGWRVELNTYKYKGDLISQLGTVWLQKNHNGPLLPNGRVDLKDFDLEPILNSPDKEIIYKKFISRSTELDGDAGFPFIKLKAKVSNHDYSKLTISVQGTSGIQPSLSDLDEMSKKAKKQIKDPESAVYVCTGMHVVKYNALTYLKTDGNAMINAPVVNIGGVFYMETNNEASEYLVVRQLTQIVAHNSKSTEKSIEQIDKVGDNLVKVEKKASKLSPVQILSIFLFPEEPTVDDLQEFYENPKSFARNHKIDLVNNETNMILINQAESIIKSLPPQIQSN